MPSASLPSIPRRYNGLSRPYTLAQLFAVSALLLSCLEWCLVVAPLLPKCASTPVTFLFLAVIGFVLHFGIHTVCTDPVDVYLCQHWQEQHHDAEHVWDNHKYMVHLYRRFNQQRQAIPVPIEEEKKHCWICDIAVAEHSMHCKFCNKCVYHFDHHCIWLNTCIGEANYFFFWRLLLWLWIMEFSHLVVQIYLLMDMYLSGPVRDRADQWMGLIPATVFMAFFLTFNVLAMIALGELIMFHRMLQQKKLTTYQVVVQNHREARTLARRQGDLEVQRVVLIQKATQEGNLWQQLSLQIGGGCRVIGCPACDPLDLPPEIDHNNQENTDFANALGDDPVVLPETEEQEVQHDNINNNCTVEDTEGTPQYVDYNETGVKEIENDNAQVRVKDDLQLVDDSSNKESNNNNNNNTNENDESERKNTHAALDVESKIQKDDANESTIGAACTDKIDTQEQDVDDAFMAAAAVSAEDTTEDHQCLVVTQEEFDPLQNTIGNVSYPDESIECDYTKLQVSSPLLCDDDKDDSNDGDLEKFEDEPEDDLSQHSGCSGRSWISNRSKGSRTSRNSQRHQSLPEEIGERDYTNF